MSEKVELNSHGKIMHEALLKAIETEGEDGVLAAVLYTPAGAQKGAVTRSPYHPLLWHVRAVMPNQQHEIEARNFHMSADQIMFFEIVPVEGKIKKADLSDIRKFQ